MAWPAAQGAAGTFLRNDGAGALTWAAAAGGGDVTAAANLVDNTLIKADGGVKGVQDTEQYCIYN